MRPHRRSRMLGVVLLAVAASLSGAAAASAQSDEHPAPTFTTILRVEGTPGDGTTYWMVIQCNPRNGGPSKVDGPTEKTMEITMLSSCGFSANVNQGSNPVSSTTTCHAEGGPTCVRNDWVDFPADENYPYMDPGNATITVTLTVEPLPPPETTTESSQAVAQSPTTTTAAVEESTTTSSTTSSSTTSTTRANDSELAATRRDSRGSGGSSPWPIVLVMMGAIATTAAVTWRVRRRRGHLPSA